MVFPCHVSPGYARLPLFHSLFLVFAMVLFSCSYLGPFIFVGFTFSSRLSFCIILLCFVCGSGSFSSGSPYLLSFRNRFSFGAHVAFWLWEPALQGSYYSRSGTVLAPGASFERKVLLTVRDRFWLQEPALEKECYFRPGTVFWLPEPGLKEECYQRSGTVFGSGSQL